MLLFYKILCCEYLYIIFILKNERHENIHQFFICMYNNLEDLMVKIKETQ
jgi:hypothetical protein